MTGQRETTAGNRRGAYRVTPADNDAIALEVVGRDGATQQGQVSDIAAGGARVNLDDAESEKIDLGSRIDLSMHLKRIDYRAQMKAQIVSSMTRGGERSLGLRFVDHHNERPDLDASVRELLNRRVNRRGALKKIREIDFDARAVAPDGRRFPVVVTDVSNGGISLLVGNEAHDALALSEKLTVDMRLPGRDGRCRVACIVHYRAERGASFRYGCEYDWRDTSDALDRAEDLAGFTMECLEAAEG